ncbi:hypothetical protein BK673_16180 [Pseudomonas fluorescens]|uniref:Uncharacterized protein n=1 Tax=Pseudomonas fluorescens TaxID=294 RepID=A0A423P4B3_PSEFL|nr:trypco2 family protein [Pseudomonas fluorescens]ROO08077.1 hypothetical protein BK673_16180 [Pseudomonas fluorescens]
MDLKDFIATSLTQIAEGILTASEALRETDAQVNPTHIQTYSNSAQGYGRTRNSEIPEQGRLVERVEFDVAVTAESSEAGKGGLKVGIASFGLNVGAEASDKAGSTSRIQFGVPMVFPSKRKS